MILLKQDPFTRNLGRSYLRELMHTRVCYFCIRVVTSTLTETVTLWSFQIRNKNYKRDLYNCFGISELGWKRVYKLS